MKNVSISIQIHWRSKVLALYTFTRIRYMNNMIQRNNFTRAIRLYIRGKSQESELGY